MTSNAPSRPFAGRPADRFGRPVLRRARAWLLDRLLAHDCALCATPARVQRVCDDCRRELPRLPASCPVCAMPSALAERCGACVRRPPQFDRTRAALPYAFPVDRVLHRLKFDARLPLATIAGDWLADSVDGAWRAGVLHGDLDAGAIDADAARVDLIVPMPLAKRRLRERGFNQSVEIARRIAARLRLPFDANALARTRETRPQIELPASARRANVRGAFSASAAVMGRRIAIVDDVMTTGASLDAAALAAKSAGALTVEAWVVARAFGPEPTD